VMLRGQDWFDEAVEELGIRMLFLPACRPSSMRKAMRTKRLKMRRR